MFKETLKKNIAVMLLMIFLVQPGYGMTAGGVPSGVEVEPLRPFRIELPPALGQVELLHAGSGPVLVHIQEAHGDPAIQKSIERMLSYLKNKYDIQQVFVEGSAFPCERRLLNLFPDNAALTHKASQRLMKQGLVSGPESFLLKNSDVSLKGVEDLQLYKRNSSSFYRVLKKKEDTADFLKDMDAQMERLSGAYLNQDLRDLLEPVKAFDEGRLSLQSLLSDLTPRMKKWINVDLEKTISQIEWPMLVRLAALQRWQSGFDAEKFASERKAFLEAAGRFLPKKPQVGSSKFEIKKEDAATSSHSQLPTSNSTLVRLESFLNSSQPAGITDIESLIEELAAKLPADFDYSRYPQLLYRFGTALIQEEMDGQQLMSEIDRAIRKLENRLAERAAEKKTVALLRDYRLAIKLLKLEWTRREYDKGNAMTYGARRDRKNVSPLSPASLTTRALALNAEGRVKDVKFEHIQELEELYLEAFDFYHDAEVRESAMAASVENQMMLSGDPKAVLITGGFHAAGLGRQFSAKNWNYALITPALSETHGRDSYVESLLQNYVSGAREKSSLKDIPYATTSLPHALAMGRSLSLYFTRLALLLNDLGVSADAISHTEVMRQIRGGVRVSQLQRGVEIQLGLPRQGPKFVFDVRDRLIEQNAPLSQAQWLQAEVRNQGSSRSEVRSNPPLDENALAGGMNELIVRLTEDWTNIQKHGAFVFDMQKTLVARKAVATPKMIKLLAWLLEEGVPLVINSGNTDKEVLDQVIDPLRSYLLSTGKLRLLSRVVVFANSGTLMAEFDPDTGAVIPNTEYQHQMRLPLIVAETIKKLMDRMSQNKFGLDSDQLTELRKIYDVESKKSKGSVIFEMPWMEEGRYSAPIKLFPEEVTGVIQAPYIQLRSLVEGQPTKIAVTKFLPGMRAGIMGEIRSELFAAIGPEGLYALDISSGGDSTIDITSVLASKSLAIRAYVNRMDSQGITIDPKYIFVHGDELTGAVEGVVTTATHEGNDLRMLSAYGDLTGVAATPKPPIGLGQDAKRTYFLGTLQSDGSVANIEEKGVETYLEKLREAVAARFKMKRAMPMDPMPAVQTEEQILPYIREQLDLYGMTALNKIDVLSNIILVKLKFGFKPTFKAVHALSRERPRMLPDQTLFDDALINERLRLLTDAESELLKRLDPLPNTLKMWKAGELDSLFEGAAQVIQKDQAATERWLNEQRPVFKQSRLDLPLFLFLLFNENLPPDWLGPFLMSWDPEVFKGSDFIQLGKEHYSEANLENFTTRMQINVDTAAGTARYRPLIKLLTREWTELLETAGWFLLEHPLAANIVEVVGEEWAKQYESRFLAWLERWQEDPKVLLQAEPPSRLRLEWFSFAWEYHFMPPSVRARLPEDLNQALPTFFDEEQMVASSRENLNEAESPTAPTNTGDGSESVKSEVRNAQELTDLTSEEIQSQLSKWRAEHPSVKRLVLIDGPMDAGKSTVSRSAAAGTGWEPIEDDRHYNEFYHLHKHEYLDDSNGVVDFVKLNQGYVKQIVLPGLMRVLSARADVVYEGMGVAGYVQSIRQELLGYLRGPLEVAIVTAKKVAEQKHAYSLVFQTWSPSLRSEVRSSSEDDDPLFQLGKSGLSGLGELLSSLSRSGLKLKVVGPDFFEKRASLLFQGLPEWMGSGAATEAWDSEFLRKEPLAEDTFNLLMAMIVKQMSDQGIAQEGEAANVLEHLRKIEISVFNEQRWATQEKNYSTLTAFAGANSVAFGRGALVDHDFAAQVLFRAGVASYIRSLKDKKEETLAESLISQVYPREEAFKKRMSEFTSLGDPEFLKDAVQRFDYFDEGSPYHRTSDLLKAWLKFDMSQDSSESDKRFAVLEQAGFLMKKLWPIFNDEKRRQDQEVVDAFTRIAYPFITFVVARHEFFRDIRVAYQKVERDVVKNAQDFMRVAEWAQQKVAEADKFPPTKLPRHPDASIDSSIQGDAAAMVVRMMAAASDPHFDPMGPGVPESIRLTFDKALKTMWEEAEQAYRRGESAYLVQPPLVMFNNPGEILTPASGARFLEEENQLSKIAMSNLPWLRQAMTAYGGNPQRNEKPSVAAEGYVTGKSELEFSEANPLLLAFSHIQNGDDLIFTDNVQSTSGIWLGISRILSQTVVDLDHAPEPTPLRLLVGGETAVASRFAQPREISYHQSAKEGLSILVYKNAVISELIDWSNGKLRSSGRENPFDKAVRGRWLALMKVGAELYKNPKYTHDYFSPHGADLSAWADDILKLRDVAESSYWRTVRQMAGSIQIEDSANPRAGRLELYNLLRNKDSVLSLLAEKLAYRPGTIRLTLEAERALINTLIALTWSGVPRSSLMYITPMIVLEAFEKYIALHPDGISVDDLEGFKKMLTREQSRIPLLSRRPEDYGEWELHTAFHERLRTYNNPDAWNEFDFPGRSFFPPDIDPATGNASFAVLRAKVQPSWYDAESFPAEYLLYPDKWPAWNYPAELQAEWVGTYTNNGLILPGTGTAYFFEPESGVKLGDLLKVAVTYRPDQDSSRLKVRVYPYVEEHKAAAKSEVRAAAKEIFRRYELIWDYFSRSTNSVEERAAILQANPIDSELIHAARERIKNLAQRSLDRMQEKNIVRAQGGFSAVINVLRIMEEMEIYEFPEIRRLDDVADPAYFLVQTEPQKIYLSQELMSDPKQQSLADFMLFLAAIDANRILENWDAETKRHIMEIAQDMFKPWAELADQHDAYVSKGLALFEQSLSQALSPRAQTEKHWQKRPVWEHVKMVDFAAQREMGETPWDEAADTVPLPRIQYAEKNEFAYRVPGGPNGLFHFNAESAPLALDIPSLSGQNVIFRPLTRGPQGREIEVYSDEKVLLGRVAYNPAREVYESDSAAVRVLSPLQPAVAHLYPKTTQEYQNVRTLAAQLSSLFKSGRGYERLDFLENEPSEDSAKVQIDAAHGIIYLARSLLGNEILAAELVEKALHEKDPIIRRQDLMARYNQLPVLAELEVGRPLLEKDAAAFSKAHPIPELLSDEDSALVTDWSKDKITLYHKLSGQLVDKRNHLVLQRLMDLHYLRSAARYNPDRKGINHTKFRGWLAEALEHRADEFFFTFLDKGRQSQTSRLDNLRWEGNKDHFYRPFDGVGIATAEHFVKDGEGRFLLGRGGRNPDSTRYLFVRYPHPQAKDETLVDVFDLNTGEPIQDEQIEFEKLRAEVASAMDQLIKQADNKEETRMDLHGLRHRLDDFIEQLVFSPAFVAEHKREKPQENLEKLLLKTKADVLGVFNQLLSTVLNSKDYSNALNFMVLEMILRYVNKDGADHAKQYAERLLSAYRLQPERLLETLGFYLMEEWKDFDPAPPATSNDPNAERIQDFLDRVLLPIGDWTHGQANDLTNKTFVDDTVFGSTVEAARVEIEKAVDGFLAVQDPAELKAGVMAFEGRFRDQYKPVPFMFRSAAPDITPLERYLIESVFQKKQEVLRDITSAQAAERATYHTQYGAGEGIGASSYLVEYRGSSLLVDAGIMIDSKNTPPNWPVFKKYPAGIFITHDHLDHVGALVKLWRDHLKGQVPIYMTRGSADLLPHVLSFMIDPSEGGGRPAFTSTEIFEVMRNIHVLEEGKWFEAAPGMKVYFHGPVGHLHGAASLIVSTPDATTFLSGDISYRSQGPVSGWKDIPEEIRKHIDRAVIESTYGVRTRSSEDREEEALVNFASNTLARGGKFLLPAFANGRSQRGLFIFLKLLEKVRRLPMQDDLKIYVDGQAGWFTLLYLNAYPETFRDAAAWMVKNLVIIPNRNWPVKSLDDLYQKMPNLRGLVTVKLEAREQSWVERRYSVNRSGYNWLSDNLREEAMERNEKQPTIIISSSGNATNGRSHRWAARLAHNALNGIAFVGYMDPQEAGSQLLEFAKKNRGVESEALRTYFFDEFGPVPVRAQVESFGLSGHISGEDMMRILESFGPALKEVIIQHGGDRQRREVFDWIREKHPEWGPMLIKNSVRYQGAVPLSLSALAERKTFFDSLEAQPLPGAPAAASVVPKPVGPITSGSPTPKTAPHEVRPAAESPFTKIEAPVPQAEFMPEKSEIDSMPAQQPVVSNVTEPFVLPAVDKLVEPVPLQPAAIEPEKKVRKNPEPAVKAAKKPARKITSAKQIKAPRAGGKKTAAKKAATGKPGKKVAAKKTKKIIKKPNTKAVYEQIQTSRTLVNAMGRLSDDDFKILAALIAALPEDATELVLKETSDHPEWRGKLSDAARTKLDAEYERRGLQRSEVRAARKPAPLDDKRRDRKITELVRFIGEEPWNEMTVSGHRRVVRRLNRLLNSGGSPFDAATIYTAFISDQEKEAIEKNPFDKLKGIVKTRPDGVVVVSPKIPEESPQVVSGLFHFFDRMGLQGQPGHGRKPLHESIIGAMALGTIHPDIRVRSSAVRALAHLPADQQKMVWPIFVRMAEQPLIEGIVLIEILAMFERQENAELIDKVLRNPKHSTQVLREAVSVLGRMTTRAQSQEQRDLAGKALMRAVFDFNLDKKVVLQAIRVVGESEPIDPAALFLSGLMASPDAEISKAAERSFDLLARRIDRHFRIPSRLRRSEVRGERTQGSPARRETELWVRSVFAEGILPVSWTKQAARSELRRVGARMAGRFQSALSNYPQLLRSAQKITQGELRRQIIDQRAGLPSVEETVPVLALLAARSSLSYVLVSGANAEDVTMFKEHLAAYLGGAEVRQRWGEIRLDKLADRFRIEAAEAAGQGSETGMKMAVMSQILSGKQSGVKSAVVSENQALSTELFHDAERYRFLNLYTPTDMGSTALVWMSAELLDELTDDLLAKFDNQALMRDLRWQGLWSEMQQLLSVSVSA